MKRIVFLVASSCLFSACTIEKDRFVADDMINGISGELTIDGDTGHLSISYRSPSHWGPVNEDVKILKQDIRGIEIQRQNGEKLAFVGGGEAPYVCENCASYYQNPFPVNWYRK